METPPETSTAAEPWPDDRLVALAAAWGIQDSYQGHSGQVEHVSRATLVAILAAMGVQAATPEEVERSLADREDAPWRRAVPEVVVVIEGVQHDVSVHLNHGAEVSVWIELDGDAGWVHPIQQDVWVPPRWVGGVERGRATFRLPPTLPVGYHRLIADTEGTRTEGLLVVAPHRAPLPDKRSWGVMAQLYSIRSRQSWGVGDFTDLGDLAWLIGRGCGADFVLINPVHAVEPVEPLTPSPYLPTSREFVSPWYIRVEEIREAAYLDASARGAVADLAVQAQSQRGALIDRDAAWALKRTALRLVYGVPRSAARAEAYERFRVEEGTAIEDFALWSVLYEHWGQAPWPAGLESPHTPAAQQARLDHAAEIDFQIWLQWIANEQLAAAQRSAVDAGMAIGVMQDLAVGVHPHGADVWTQGDLLATGATVGAPPDMYNQLGQNWSQPPWRPDQLVRSGYEVYRAMLRRVLRHSGAVRIDHIIGLFRLWWIPAGHGARDGAYVRYDHEALVGILCIEAQRAGALVIGEDLGTFEHWVSDYLADRGLLGTSVLWFEKEWDGSPKAPEHYRRPVLASITTHDLPPTAGYLAGEHVELRERLGLLTVPVEQERLAAARELSLIESALRDRGLVGDDPSQDDLVRALHRYLVATPSVLLGVSLADAVGERRAQNQPGTDQEYPNWKIPLGDGAGHDVLLDDLMDLGLLRALAEVMDAGTA